MRSLHEILTVVVTAAVVAIPATARSADPEPGNLARLEGHTLEPVSQDDLRMLAIMVGSVTRGAEAEGRMTPGLQALARDATAAMRDGKPTEAFRMAVRLLAVLGGAELGDALEAATAYDLELDRKIVAPGDPITVRLAPLFTLDRPLEEPVSAELTLLAPGGDTRPLPPLTITALEPRDVSIPTAGLGPGRYDVRYRLVAGDRAVAEGHRDFLVAPTVPGRVLDLRAAVARIDGMKLDGASQQAAADTAAYFADLIGSATTSYVAVARGRMHPMIFSLRAGREVGADVTEARVAQAGRETFDLDTDLPLAEELAAALLAGRDPFAGRTGDLHLAHRSPIDGSLQPYRAFIPPGYDPTHRYPLVIALHGASGDENAFMERSGFKEEAAKRGYFLATPNGRGPFGGYRDASGADVLEVLDRMLAMYSIDPRQVFLTGHSMGGGGTWRVGFAAPERFAALAPMAGAPARAQVDLAAAPDMPVLLSAGVKDRVVPIATIRRLAAIAEQELHHFTFVEYPEADHPDVPRSALVPIFDFFDAHRAPAEAARGDG